MATREERAALLAVPCPHCGSAPGEDCVLPHVRTQPADRRRHRRAPGPSTLDGGCHDARWQAALGRGAGVRAGVLAAVTGGRPW